MIASNAMPGAVRASGEAGGGTLASTSKPGSRVMQAAPVPARTGDVATAGGARVAFRESIEAVDAQAEAVLDAHDVARDGDIVGLPAEVADRAEWPMPTVGAAFAGIAPALAMTLGAGSAASGAPAATPDADAMARTQTQTQTQTAAPASRAPMSLADAVNRMVVVQADVVGRASPATRSSAEQATADVAPQAAAPAARPPLPARSAMPSGVALPAAFVPVSLAGQPPPPTLFAVRRQPAVVAGDAPRDAASRLPVVAADVPPIPPAAPAGVTATPAAASTLTAAFAAKADAASPDTSGQALLSALGDRIHLQAAQGLQRAVIRLDPHLAGSVVIDLRHEAGAISVQMSASHADVARQLQTMSESLRQDLAGRQYTEVSVQVAPHRGAGREPGGHGQGEGRDPQRRDTRRPGHALSDADTVQAFESASR